MVGYRYEPLPGKDFIRLVTIHPGEFADDIVISLEVTAFPLDNPPVYEALSYVWGLPSDPGLVHVTCSRAQQRTTILATQNLVVALRHLRYVDKPRVMWMDALSINQKADVEKSSQVAKMGEVFRLATRVVAWLGPEENDSDHAIGLMEYFGSQIDVDWDYGFDEIYLAKSEAIVFAGFRRITWNTLRRALHLLHMKCISLIGVPNDFGQKLISLEGFIYQRLDMSVRDFMYVFGNSRCHDPRDRIYGALSLLDKENRAIIPEPDYTKHWAQIYQDIATRYMRRTTRLDLLLDCESLAGQTCASWVLDWSRDSTGNGQVARSYASAQLCTISLKPESGVLKVVGVSKTIIEHIEPIPDFQYWGSREVCGSLIALLQNLDLQGKYVTGIDLLEAYTRILLCALRPCGGGRFLVVGGCFVEGISQGEALLGTLPHGVRTVSIYVEAYGRYYPGLVDSSSGKTFFEDPRLASLPLDLGDFRIRLSKDPRATMVIDPDVLQARGVDIKTFSLVQT
ncbi:Uu.00g041910.m01.CDS01 [Anthostomella pinea]|uniref:Uu.00g041910.m01.CDS01 n=1 Tax=Anthostomella pinea TaxID=933095 RepID=A0AAI8V5H8_9PEZI|nr:Uu.00g041910.m01.CDS01 [Anthostomella pinea]